MSGICGVVNLDGAPVDPETPKMMAQAASHRGPDGIRHHTKGPAGLSHLALNITPESLHERQPLVEGGLVLTADARIDNREELVVALREYVRSDSPTDADLILAAYRRWGVQCPSRLIGDFAFAIWDERRRRLFAARDPMAMRAFYYRMESGRFLFGTEAKQVLAAPGVARRIFEPAVGAYLAGCFGPLEWSFHEGISQLAPAHALVVEEGRHRVWRYWDIDPERRIEYASEEEYVEHFFEVFGEAVRSRMRSVKPVGIFLSGGMDSGSMASVAGRMARLGGSAFPEFRSYSWAFEELVQCDERHISDGVVRHYGLPSTEVPADDLWPLAGYPDHGPDLDEPLIGVYQALLEHTLSMARSEKTALVFSGDRGDLMVGDVAFDHLGLLRAGRFGMLREELVAHGRWHGVPAAKMALYHLLGPALRNLWPRGREFVRRTRRSLRGGEAPAAYPDWVRTDFARRIGLDDIARGNEEPRSPMGDEARDMRYKLIFVLMHMRGTVWSERTWSRFGIGFADPWSDRRLAEFILAIPQWRVQRVRERKRIARLAMRGVMPAETLRKTSKISPQPLYERALRERATDTIQALITDSHAAARGFLNEETLQNHYSTVRRGKPEDPRLWWAITLEMWLRRYWSQK